MDITGISQTGNGDNSHWHILSEIRKNESESNANFRALENDLSRNAAVAAKDSADGVYRIHDNVRNVTDTILTSTALTNSKIAESEKSISEKLSIQSLATANGFAAVALDSAKNTASILAAMAATELRGVQDKLDALREKHESDRHAYGLALQNQEISNMKNLINSVEQTQRFSSKTVQFGAGNVAIPTQTANQG